MATEQTLALTEGMNFKVHQEQNSRIIKAMWGVKDYTDQIPLRLREEALKQNVLIVYEDNQFKLVGKDYTPAVELPEAIEAFNMDFVHTSYRFKPADVFINELKWKFLMRNVVKGKNIKMTGGAGSGKTTVAKAVAKVLDRPFFYFNLGAMQDPRASLIGSTLFNTGEGTYFTESQFVKAIRTENAIILLDEYTRMHPDAGNILMTILDPTQRYLRLDEKEGQEVVPLAKGVSFIATANIGNEYTGTRVTDRALDDRFSVIEMDLLDEDEEAKLCKMRFPNADDADIRLLTQIAARIRSEYLADGAKLSAMMSTRMTLEAAELIEDNFTIAEALEITLLPLYDQAGGASSERQHAKQIIDSFLPKGADAVKGAWNKKVSANNPFYKATK